jgi:hypothetical protein
LHSLRTALTAIHGAAYYITHEQASSSNVGTGNLMMLRALSGCSFPDNEEGAGSWDDKLHLAELQRRLRSVEMKGTLSKEVSCKSAEETVRAYQHWGFDLRLDVAAGATMPLHLDVLVVNELLLNALRASAVAMWKSRSTCHSTRAFISIDCDSSYLTITNTALQSSIERACRRVKRPEGQASGWGHWATQQLLQLLGLPPVIREAVNIGGEPALRTKVQWGS